MYCVFLKKWLCDDLCDIISYEEFLYMCCMVGMVFDYWEVVEMVYVFN